MKSRFRLFFTGKKNEDSKLQTTSDITFQFLSKKGITDYSGGFMTPDCQDDIAAINQLMSRLDQSPVKTKQIISRRKFLYVASVAASVFLLAGLSLYFFSHKSAITITAAPGQQTSIFLPDSSQVILNAASVVRYNPKHWKNHRKILLEGEGFFRVKKGARFDVVSQNCIITVLGTSFNVFARGNEFKMSCFTGKVSVKTRDNSSEQVINSGYETSLKAGNILTIPCKFDIRKTAAWQKGEFYFHNEPLINVFHEMERQFKVTIDAGNLTDRYFTGCFFRTNIQQALKIVCDPMQLDYLVRENYITIRDKTK